MILSAVADRLKWCLANRSDIVGPHDCGQAHDKRQKPEALWSLTVMHHCSSTLTFSAGPSRSLALFRQVTSLLRKELMINQGAIPKAVATAFWESPLQQAHLKVVLLRNDDPLTGSGPTP